MPEPTGDITIFPPRVHHPARRRGRAPERGQVLALLAISMLAMMAMAGLLVDGGRSWGVRRQVQTAADAAALAAMKAMTAAGLVTAADRASAATTAANAMAVLNGAAPGPVSCPGDPVANGVVVNNPPKTGPHAADADYVEVLVTRAMPTSFSAVVGQPCWLVSARAVARIVPEVTVLAGAPYPAILATYGPTPCAQDAYHNSAQFTVYGNVISNSGIHDSSVMTTTSTVSYVSNPPNVCGTRTTGTAAWTGTAVANPTAYPVTYTFNTTARTVTNDKTGQSVACTYWFGGNTNLGSGSWWSGGSTQSRQLNPGVFCATGDIGLATNSTVGNVTFVAGGKITISAGSTNIRAYWDNLLGLAYFNGATTTSINFSGSNGQWQGLLFAPNAQVRVSGGGNYTYSAALWGRTVITSGTGWVLNSLSIPVPPQGTSVAYRIGTLVE